MRTAFHRPLALLLSLALLLAGCVGGEGESSPSPVPSLSAGAEVERRSATGFYFDTVVTVTAYVSDPSVVDAALRECAKYENLLSKTVEGSDVWALNHAGGEWVEVSEETREILEKALEYSRLSDGLFDVTVEPCTALWDFTGGSEVLPDPDALAAAAAKVDYTAVELGETGVRLRNGATIDLGAIAKGYITDRIASFLVERGVESAILNFGGNVLTIGSKPGGEAWKIGVQDPRSPRGESIGVLPVTGKAVVTSGIYERGFDKDGIRYHHILDAATGWPIQNELAGVTIVAEDAFDADALSTTVFAMGSEDGLAFVEELDGVEAIFVTREDAVTWSSGLEGKLSLLSGAD